MCRATGTTFVYSSRRDDAGSKAPATDLELGAVVVDTLEADRTASTSGAVRRSRSYDRGLERWSWFVGVDCKGSHDTEAIQKTLA